MSNRTETAKQKMIDDVETYGARIHATLGITIRYDGTSKICPTGFTYATSAFNLLYTRTKNLSAVTLDAFVIATLSANRMAAGGVARAYEGGAK